MTIEAGNPQVLFAVFYILSAITVLLATSCFTKSEKLPTGTVLLVLSATIFATIAGTRLFTIPVGEWLNVLVSNPGSITGRSAIGGLVFGLTAFLISARLLGLGKQSFTLYAWITPLALGIQKIGCFFNGCCYGITTGSSLGITYPAGSSAHFNHLLSGTISDYSMTSGKVVPVQLIEVAAYLLIAYMVWRARMKWKREISSILLFFILLFTTRFFTEFIRDPISSPFRNEFLGIRIFQWVLLLAAFFCTVVLLVLEKYRNIKDTSRIAKPLDVNSALASLFVMGGLIFSIRDFFSFYEKVSLALIFIPSVLFIAYQFLFPMPVLRQFCLKASLFTLPLFLMYPAIAPDRTKIKKERKPYYTSEFRRYRKVEGGTAFGQYYNTVYYNPHQGDCGTAYSYEHYKNAFGVAGGGYSVVNVNEKSIGTRGINVFGGSLTEHNFETLASKRWFIGGINPYAKIDSKWAGAGIGVYAGNLRWIIQHESESKTPIGHASKSFPFMPQVELRLGRKDILDVRYSYGMNSYSTFPVLTNEISLGSGFGNKTDFSLRLGIAASGINDNRFISGEWMMNKKLGMNLKYHFGTYSSYYPGGVNPREEPRAKGIIILGAGYRFGFEK